MTDAEIAEAKERADAATDGPWTERVDEDRPDWHLVFGGGDFAPMDVIHVPPHMAHVESNAALVAAARTDVPALVAAALEARALVREMATAMDKWASVEYPFAVHWREKVRAAGLDKEET